MSSHPQTEAIGEPKHAGRTFGDFIEACRKLGLTDETELASIEYGVMRFGSGRMVAEVGEQGIEVREL